MYRKGIAINPVDAIAGVILVLAGLITIFGMVNLGAALGGIGLLIEAIKILLQSGP